MGVPPLMVIVPLFLTSPCIVPPVQFEAPSMVRCPAPPTVTVPLVMEKVSESVRLEGTLTLNMFVFLNVPPLMKLLSVEAVKVPLLVSCAPGPMAILLSDQVAVCPASD